MPDKMNYVYCEFQKYEIVTMSVVGGQPKNTQIPVIKQQNTSNALFQSLIITCLIRYTTFPQLRGNNILKSPNMRSFAQEKNSQQDA